MSHDAFLRSAEEIAVSLMAPHVRGVYEARLPSAAEVLATVISFLAQCDSTPITASTVTVQVGQNNAGTTPGMYSVFQQRATTAVCAVPRPRWSWAAWPLCRITCGGGPSARASTWPNCRRGHVRSCKTAVLMGPVLLECKLNIEFAGCNT